MSNPFAENLLTPSSRMFYTAGMMRSAFLCLGNTATIGALVTAVTLAVSCGREPERVNPEYSRVMKQAADHDVSYIDAGDDAGCDFKRDKYDVIILSIDTLRSDRLGCYGHDKPTSPAMDAFAAESVRFENVIAESCWTLPSHMTIFTGLHSPTHAVLSKESVLHERKPILGEILEENGYESYGYTGGGYVAGRYGHDRGFEYYLDEEKHFSKRVDEVIERLEEARSGENPYFLFIHTYHVHEHFKGEYLVPLKYKELFFRQSRRDYLRAPTSDDLIRMSPRPGQVAFLLEQYNAHIRVVDDGFKKLIDYLNERNALEGTIFILLSDHGEEFMEHGSFDHRTLYTENLRVPAIFSAPGLGSRVIEEPVSHVDIMPTLLDMLGI